MAGATIATLDKILKDMYLPPVVEQLNNEILMLSRLESTSDNLVGRQAFVPVHKGRSGGIGSRPELGTLPTAGNQSYDRAAYDLKYHYGIIQVSGPSMAKTASDAGAFLRSLQSELDGIRTDLKQDVSRQLYGPGTGVIASIASSTGTVHTLTSDEPLRKGYIYVGMQVDVMDVAFAGFRASAGAVVTAVSIAGPTFTTAALTGVVATDVVVRSGAHTDASGAASATNNEIDAGLQALVSTTPTVGTVGGINRATAGNEYWQNLTLSLATLSLDNLQKCWGTVRTAGGETSVQLTSFGVQRQFYGLLQSQVRFSDPMTMKAGFQTLSFMNKEFVADRHAPYGRIYFLDEQFIKVFSDRDWHPLDEDGLSLKWVSGKDAWQSILARYMNLGISRCNVQLVGTGITDTTGV